MADKNRAIRELAENYNISFGERLFIRRGYKKLRGLIEERCKNKEKRMLLDIGCGPGVFSDIFREREREREREFLYGLDSSLNSLNSKRVFNRVCGDVVCSPFKDNSFDVVISRSSMGYWSNKGKSFDEILRILKPGGHFFISDIKKTENKMLKCLLLLLDIILVGSFKKMDKTRYAIDTRCDVGGLKLLLSTKKIDFRIKDHLLIYFIVIGRKK